MKWERIQYPSVEEVIQLHEEILVATGGAVGVLNRDGLEASVMAPQATWGGTPLLRSLAAMAAAYAYYLATSHSFADGNKRTAISVALAFLGVNGYRLDADVWEDHMVAVVTGTLSLEQLTVVFANEMGGDEPIE